MQTSHICGSPYLPTSDDWVLQCHQSSAPCKEISSLQDILINRRQVLNLFVHFFGGIAFGTNLLFCCDTDANFTMSISHIFLKGRPEYHINDDVIVYFCFLTWEWQFHFIQVITSCSILSFHIVYHATWNMR